MSLCMVPSVSSATTLQISNTITQTPIIGPAIDLVTFGCPHRVIEHELVGVCKRDLKGDLVRTVIICLVVSIVVNAFQTGSFSLKVCILNVAAAILRYFVLITLQRLENYARYKVYSEKGPFRDLRNRNTHHAHKDNPIIKALLHWRNRSRKRMANVFKICCLVFILVFMRRVVCSRGSIVWGTLLDVIMLSSFILSMILEYSRPKAVVMALMVGGVQTVLFMLA